MSSRRTFLVLSAIMGNIGIGMLLGYELSDHVDSAPLWVGVVLVFFGVLLLGMFISATGRERSAASERPVSSSGNITDLPPKQQR